MSGTNGWGTDGGPDPYRDPHAPQDLPRLEYDPYTGQYYDPAQQPQPFPAAPQQYGYQDGYPQTGQQPYGGQPAYGGQQFDAGQVPADPYQGAAGHDPAGYPGAAQQPYPAPYAAEPYPGQGVPPQQQYDTGHFAPGAFDTGHGFPAGPGGDPYAGQGGYGDQGMYGGPGEPGMYAGPDPYQAGGVPTGPQDVPYGTPDGTAPDGSTPGGGAGSGPAVPPQGPGPDGGPGGPEAGGTAEPAAADGRDGGARVYETTQFRFVREETDEADDAIDWLKFAETRSERRDEKRRKTRGRAVGVAVALVLVLLVAGGWFWWSHRGGDGAGGSTATAADRRDVIAVHLRDLKGSTSNLLLVDNHGTKRGSTLLLPGSLALPDDSGTVRLEKALDEQGPSGTRDALSTVLGADISGSWRLDSPFLKIMVDKLGGIELDADTEISSGGKKLLDKGHNTDVNGTAAVAYATHRGKDDKPDAAPRRFGAVMDAVLQKMPTDPSGATTVVKSMNSVLDPSLTADKLGATLAALAKERQAGKYRTVTMPVAANGSLPAGPAGKIVKDVLGGAVKSPASGSARVALRNASGSKDHADQAHAALANAGYTMVPGGGTAQIPQRTSRIAYSDAKDRKAAEQAAAALGLPKSTVTHSTSAQTADIAVTLGQDYQP